MIRIHSQIRMEMQNMNFVHLESHNNFYFLGNEKYYPHSPKAFLLEFGNSKIIETLDMNLAMKPYMLDKAAEDGHSMHSSFLG